jgi:NADH-quinone oxidoreductase subunit J
MIFLGLSIASIFLALATVFTKHIFRSAIYLMGVLTLSAGFYLLLGAEFLAGVQILVYVGGIVILIVFAVMLTQSQDLLEDRPSLHRKVLGAITSLSFFGASAYSLAQSNFLQEKVIGTEPVVIANLGRAFLSTEGQGYLVPFELISLLLLAVLIAGVVLARKEKSL